VVVAVVEAARFPAALRAPRLRVDRQQQLPPVNAVGQLQALALEPPLLSISPVIGFRSSPKTGLNGCVPIVPALEPVVAAVAVAVVLVAEAEVDVVVRLRPLPQRKMLRPNPAELMPLAAACAFPRG